MAELTDPQSPPAALRKIYSISELNREAREILEGNFPLLWVEGEISNLARPASGHIYFSLKDARAQVRCAMFRQRNRLLNFSPGNGMQVLARVRVSLYETRGDFQLLIEHMEEAGDGALRRAFEALKQRLYQEGLFDEAHKQPVPALPRRIGVVTSPTGAAIRDILTVLRRRFPAIPVLVYPVPVQGAVAAGEIAATLQLAAGRNECDVLILARGGGSLEDLWAFNEEQLARAIHACPLPVVCGVGHEIDVTIADFVADRRAPTPSAAAELVSPDQQELLARLDSLQQNLVTRMQSRLRQHRQRLDWLAKRLQHPGQRLMRHAQRLDELESRLDNSLQGTLRHARARLAELYARLQQQTPRHRLARLEAMRRDLTHRLTQAMHNRQQHARQQLASGVRALEAVSPLATLSRGYAIVRRRTDGVLLRDARQAQVGDAVEAQLASGRLLCRVEASEND
jgi:exodeoxyribonuclease VII large subunit